MTRPSRYTRLYLVSAYALADMSGQTTCALSEFNCIFTNPVYSLSVVEARERQEPNGNPVAIAGGKFHDGLLRADMGSSGLIPLSGRYALDLVERNFRQSQVRA